MHGLCCWFFVYPVGSEHCKLCCVYSGRYFVWSHLNSYGIVSHTWCVNLFSPKSVLARSKLIAKRGGALCMHGFCDSETERVHACGSLAIMLVYFSMNIHVLCWYYSHLLSVHYACCYITILRMLYILLYWPRACV